MKIKLDDFYVRALINVLMNQRGQYDDETNISLDDILLYLVDVLESIKPNRKKKIPFQSVDTKVIRQCLIQQRNIEIEANKQGAVDVLNELLILFI